MVTQSNGTTDSTKASPAAAPAEAEARDRATSVVLAYRAIDWDAVKAGDEPAMRALVNACELHDATRRFLAEEDCGETGAKLDRGLDRFYADSVGPRLGDPLVVLQLSQLPAAGASNESMSDVAPSEDGLSPRSRPQVTVGHTVRMNTGCGHLYVTVNESEDGKPFELFNHMGKAGGCAASQNEAIGRLISYSLRCGAKLDPLIKQLKGISCHRPAWGEGGKISSCSDAIGKALETYHHRRELREQRPLAAGKPDAQGQVAPANGLSNGNGNGPAVAAPATTRRETLGSGVSFEDLQTTDKGADRWLEAGAELRGTVRAKSNGGGGNHDIHRVQGACVDCGSQLSFEEGCVKCHSCGFTECG